jgi:hypothetical protein
LIYLKLKQKVTATAAACATLHQGTISTIGTSKKGIDSIGIGISRSQ